MCHFDWPRQKGILSVASPSSLPGWEKSKEVQLMKKTFRRALSLTIASGLTLAMAVTAGAAEGDTLTRGEMAKLLVEGAGLTGQVEQYQAQESVFQDVPEDSEYKGYINLAYAQGLVSGTGAARTPRPLRWRLPPPSCSMPASLRKCSPPGPLITAPPRRGSD